MCCVLIKEAAVLLLPRGTTKFDKLTFDWKSLHTYYVLGSLKVLSHILAKSLWRGTENDHWKATGMVCKQEATPVFPLCSDKQGPILILSGRALPNLHRKMVLKKKKEDLLNDYYVSPGNFHNFKLILIPWQVGTESMFYRCGKRRSEMLSNFPDFHIQ